MKNASFSSNCSLWARYLLLSSFAFLLSACPSLESDDSVAINGNGDADSVRRGLADYAEFSIFWATDRELTGNTDPKSMFAGDRGPGTLVYGTSKISVPNDRKVGETRRPAYWRFIFGEDPEKDMVLLRGGTNILEKDPWFRQVRDRVDNGERTAFVFVHGYNTTFEEAALRTAQIGYDLEFSGAPILYSWPSKGSRFDYAVDEEDARWSRDHLVEFLMDIRNRAGADNVTLIAHSLGGRLLSSALESLGNSSFADGEVLFNEIILSAPDIDADIFRTQIMPAMRKLANGRTLYASSEDWALIFARDFLRGGQPRAGNSGDQIIVMPDLDTIDATDVRTDFGRHQDVSNRPVLTDMYALIREGKRAAERQYLREQETANGVFWRLAP